MKGSFPRAVFFLLALLAVGKRSVICKEDEAGGTATMPVVTIGIAGGTGAGKTTLAKAVYRDLEGEGNVAYLVHDNYYKDITHLSMEERAKTNFDHPDSLDTDLLVEHVKELKLGKSIFVPNYDFSTHSRTSDTTRVDPKKIILVEGILIFAEPKLVEQLDIKVFVDADSDIRLMRRIARDTSERGRSVDEVMEQYQTTVRPMHDAFVEPSKQVADIIVHSTGVGEKTSVALRMITNHLRLEAGLSQAGDSADDAITSEEGKQSSISEL